MVYCIIFFLNRFSESIFILKILCSVVFLFTDFSKNIYSILISDEFSTYSENEIECEKNIFYETHSDRLHLHFEFSLVPISNINTNSQGYVLTEQLKVSYKTKLNSLMVNHNRTDLDILDDGHTPSPSFHSYFYFGGVTSRSI